MSNGSGVTRWWENYLVRYFLPSIAGMVIVRWLALNAGGIINRYVPFDMTPLKDLKNFGTAHLVLWILFGSLYCYIASYPVLVFHATRILDFKDRGKTIFGDWEIFRRCLNPYIHSAVFAFLAYTAAWLRDTPCFSEFSVGITIFSVIFFVAIQIIRLVMTFSNSKIAYAYLDALSIKRGTVEENGDTVTTQRRGDLVESYRHLREHGNTAFIFILELALAPIFLVALKEGKNLMDFSYVSILLIVWAFPAMLVHFLGQHLERRFSLFDNQEKSSK